MSTPLPPLPPSLPLLPSDSPAGLWPDPLPNHHHLHRIPQPFLAGDSQDGVSFPLDERKQKRPRISPDPSIASADGNPAPAAKISDPDSDSPSKNRVGTNSNGLAGISRMFFKTKLCCKFRMGACPYSTNCNFAHGIEELRNPPPNWQEIVANASATVGYAGNTTRDEELRGNVGGSGTWGDAQKINRFKICKKFYNGEGCPYGERCNFLHEDPSRSRESVSINVGLRGSIGQDVVIDCSDDSSNQKPVYWKTRICNKWETTGNCPFGDKCCFAHGIAELKNYGGGSIEGEIVASGVAGASNPMNPYDDAKVKVHTHARFAKWKSPEKINRIYADWIDDIE